MAITLTKNLKLRLSSNASDTSRYNLERIDLTYGLFPSLTEGGDLGLRAPEDIFIEPQSPDVGGSGGGTVTIGNATSAIVVLGTATLAGSRVLTQLDRTALELVDTNEGIARAAADITLQGNITAEALARAAADLSLRNDLNAEIALRTTLRNDLTAESNTRAWDDGILTYNLNAEAVARQAADAAHLVAIDHAPIVHTNRQFLDVVTGTNTGDETITSIQTKLGVATTNYDGYLTHGDWNIFNGKMSSALRANLSGVAGRTSVTGGSGAILTAASVDVSTNILPAPLTADIGKALVVTAAGHAAWTVVGSGSADHKVAVSSGDASPSYLNDKIWAGTGITTDKLNSGTNELVRITNADPGSTAVGSHEGTYIHTRIPAAAVNPTDDGKAWVARAGVASWEDISAGSLGRDLTQLEALTTFGAARRYEDYAIEYGISLYVGTRTYVLGSMPGILGIAGIATDDMLMTSIYDVWVNYKILYFTDSMGTQWTYQRIPHNDNTPSISCDSMSRSVQWDASIGNCIIRANGIVVTDFSTFNSSVEYAVTNWTVSSLQSFWKTGELAGTSGRVAVSLSSFGSDPVIDVATTLLPSPGSGDVGKVLQATGAGAAAWTTPTGAFVWLNFPVELPASPTAGAMYAWLTSTGAEFVIAGASNDYYTLDGLAYTIPAYDLLFTSTIPPLSLNAESTITLGYTGPSSAQITVQPTSSGATYSLIDLGMRVTGTTPTFPFTPTTADSVTFVINAYYPGVTVVETLTTSPQTVATS